MTQDIVDIELSRELNERDRLHQKKLSQDEKWERILDELREEMWRLTNILNPARFKWIISRSNRLDVFINTMAEIVERVEEIKEQGGYE
jgi:coenzyme F420-reducing hydrogenase delta subunit